MVDARSLDAIFAAALREEVAPWPSSGHNFQLIQEAMVRIQLHGIACLLHERQQLLEGWPEQLISWLRHQTIGRVMWEHAHKSRIAKLLDRLHGASIPCRVLKGTAIAYAHYSEPAHRVRGDTDLLILPGDRRGVREIFIELGFSRPLDTEGFFGDLHYQETWQSIDTIGLKHHIDLHWEVTNSRALRPLLNVEEFIKEQVPLPRLCEEAVTVSLETRLLHGFVNRAMHASGPFYLDGETHRLSDRLIWANDLRVQAQDLTEDTWDNVAQRCADLGIAPFAEDAFRFAGETLKVEIPASASQILSQAVRQTRVTQYICQWGGFRRGAADFMATQGLRAKLRYLLARAFPASEHLRWKYPELQHWPLPLLYLHRMLSGVKQIFSPLSRQDG